MPVLTFSFFARFLLKPVINKVKVIATGLLKALLLYFNNVLSKKEFLPSACHLKHHKYCGAPGLFYETKIQLNYTLIARRLCKTRNFGCIQRQSKNKTAV